MVQITTKELKELLETAFDKGWMGYCDLKEAVVQELLERYKDQEVKAKGCPVFDGHVFSPIVSSLVGPDWSALESGVWTSGSSSGVWTMGIDPPTENSN